MVYAPRALRHFSLAAMESRAQRTAELRRPVPMKPTPVQVRPVRSRTVVRLWLPTTYIFLLLAPLALLLAPLVYLAPRPYRVRPFATVLGIGQVLLSLGGTEVHVETPDALVRIRIF